MNELLIKKASEKYKLAELDGIKYFNDIASYIYKDTYSKELTNDFNIWKENHVKRWSIFSYISRKRDKSAKNDYYTYIKYLHYRGKLYDYLDRSISYIYMRDLGEDLNNKTTVNKVNDVVIDLENNLIKAINLKSENSNFDFADIYIKAKAHGLEDAFVWVVERLKNTWSNMPDIIDAFDAKRKLIKIICGVFIHQYNELDKNISNEEKSEKLSKALRLGYCYGLTYPFIDDVLDSKLLSIDEKRQYSDIIRTTLITGEVPEILNWKGNNEEIVRYIHKELKEAFKLIKEYQVNTHEVFSNFSYVFFNAQEKDRNKTLDNATYTNEDIYIPIILKSAYSRLIVPSVLGNKIKDGFMERSFYYGIYNQLADDFTDMFEDEKNNSLTPYTYYFKYHKERPDLINPFELYWSVVYNLIHNVYEGNSKVCEIILDRAVNSLKRFKGRVGNEKYSEIMGNLSFNNSDFGRLINYLVDNAEEVEFFDKLLRDHTNEIIKNESEKVSDFKEKTKSLADEINNMLEIVKATEDLDIDNTIVEAANYAIGTSGKRIRPILTYMVATEGYNLNKDDIKPLLKSLEYMHTASLIFDDLPSEDNASLRRGRLTLHKVYNSAIAELTGIFLTQKAIEEQTKLKGFPKENIINVVNYSTAITQRICYGQAMDLNSKKKKLNLQELRTLCIYKTALAFEAALIMPAILAGSKSSEIEALKNFAKYAGIAFQIKDDILDVEGDTEILGKVIGIDNNNKTSTFVTILGIEKAKIEMWDNYNLALEALKTINIKTEFLKQLLNYIINRDS